MTTPSTARKAGPLLGNGSTTAFPFTFKVFAAADVAVTIANSSGVETPLVLNTDYSVTLNSNQDTSPGGTITYPISGAALPSGSKLSIVGDLDYDQPLDLPSGGNFSPTALENQLDRATMQIQQLKEEVDRAAQVPVTSDYSVDQLSADLIRIADSADNLDTVAANIAAVNTVASDLNEPVSEINTVAVNIANVNAVGNNITDVNTVATNIADVGLVADVAASVPAVASVASSIPTVAGISADVSAVAAIDDAVSIAAANVADINNFADVYQGGKTADPTVRNDGSALQSGDLYFNTTLGRMRIRVFGVWDDAVSNAGSVVVESFSGTGSQTVFTLATNPLDKTNTQVFIAGVYQQKSEYSVLGTALTFTAAPPSGTSNIEVVIATPVAFGNLSAIQADVTTKAATATTGATTATTQAGVATTQAGLATSAKVAAESARDAALLSRGVFATTAKALSRGVASVASLVGGSGGTNGTFDLAFSGGAGSGAAGRFVVAGGAVTSITITATGDSYTSAPTISFAASSGLTGASATAVIANNVDIGEYFSVPLPATYGGFQLYQNVASVATLVSTINSAAYNHQAHQVLRQKFLETNRYAIRNWIQELSTLASKFQIYYSGGATRNADGSYTIPAGGSVTWDLSSHTASRAPYGPWAQPNGGGVLVPGPGSSRYFAVYQPDPTVAGLSLKVQGFAPSNNLATWTQTAPGLWQGEWVVGSQTNILAALVVSNTGSSSITVLQPFAGTVPFGLLQSFNLPEPPKQLPVRDWKWSFPSSPAGDRNWRERQITYAVDSVSGSNANNGTNVNTPKQTITGLPTFASDNVTLGLWRGSVFREKGKTGGANDSGGSGGNRKGVLVRDIRQSRAGTALPIISALDPAPNGSFVNNGDGTYSYTWTGAETLLDDGYSNVYIVEINTATTGRSPISAAKRMRKLASAPAVAAAAGTSFIQSLGSNQWKATIRPSDSLAPGSGTYRYEVVSRLQPSDWFGYSRDGQIEGLHLVGSNSGYGSIGGTNYFDADRIVVQHATTHGAVVGGGKLSRSLIYGASDSPSGNIGWTWYATNTPGFVSHIDWCYFKDSRQSAIYGHNSGGANAAEAIVENCVLDAGLTDSDPCTGNAAGHNSVDYYTFRGNYVLGGYNIGCQGAPTYDLVIENNIFRDVARGIASAYYGASNRYFIRNNVFRFRSWSDPSSVNNRGASFFDGGNTNVRDKLFVENNLVHLRSTAATLTNDNNVSFVTTPYGYFRRNIIILEQFDTSSGSLTYVNGDDTDLTAYVSDYNLVVCNRALGEMRFSTRRSGGGAFSKGWDEYRAVVGQDANTLWIDVSADPRGVKAVFVDPANGDYRFANTDLGRRAADYCVANGVGPTTVISKWPEIPSVDDAYRMIRDL